MLARVAAKESLSIEPFDTLDAQGAPSYDASQSIEGWVKETDELRVDADGSDVRITLTIWVPGDESPLPSERDRITRSGSTYIVEFERVGQDFRGNTDHVRVECRDE